VDKINLKIFSDKLPAPSAFTEVFAFSINKCGSSLMNGMLEYATGIIGLPAISLPDTFFKNGILDKEWQEDRDFLGLIKPGILYYGFRFLPPTFMSQPSVLKNKRQVLLVRDPRDALVSEYFSYGKKNMSHVLPGKNQLEFYNNLESSYSSSIDTYVLETAYNHYEKLVNYKNHLDWDNVKLFKYEDIFFDKKIFLNDIFVHFKITIPEKVIDEVSSQYDIRPSVEDEEKHIRQGFPGDHLKKLKKETIFELNNIFKDISKFYGYNLS